MRIRNLITLGTVVLASVLAVTMLSDAGDDSPKNPSEKKKSSAKPTRVMKDKLKFTHQLITGLAREDFKTLEENARALRRIAREQWIAEPTPEYRSQLQVFWTTLEGIEDGAKRKNIEEATLAYMQMTLSCVRCHKAIRRDRQQE